MATGAPDGKGRLVPVPPLPRQLAGCGGFTYTAMIVAVVIVGIMLAATGQLWSTIMQREREEELIFRGLMIRNAIERWYKPLPGQTAASPLMELKHLTEDPRALQKTRYLSRLYEDPLTGKEWKVIKGDVGGIAGIVGVASTSDGAPIKTADFPEVLKELEGKKKYSEWQFIYKETSDTAAAGATTPGGATSGTRTPGGATPGGTTPGGATPGGTWDPINAEFR